MASEAVRLRPWSRVGRAAWGLSVGSFWVAVEALQMGGGEQDGQLVRSACAAPAGAAVGASPPLASAGSNCLHRERCAGTGSWR